MACAVEHAAQRPKPGFRVANALTEDAPDLPQVLHISGIPLLMPVRSGGKAACRAGLMPAWPIVSRARAAAA
jgi:hypothetical protein